MIFPVFLLIFPSCAGVKASDIYPFPDLENSKNACQAIIIKPGPFTDVTFLVCKTEKITTEVTCQAKQKDPRNRPGVENKILKIFQNKVLQRDPTGETYRTSELSNMTDCSSVNQNTLSIKTTTVTQYLFPVASASGGLGPLLTGSAAIGAATVGAAAVALPAIIK